MGIYFNHYSFELFAFALVSVCWVNSLSEGVSLTTKQSKIQQYLNAQTDLTDQLLNGYDKRFIPAIPEEPLKVKLKIEISDVLRLDDQEMECELIIYIRQIWNDYRLSWKNNYLRNGSNSTTNAVSIKRLKIREHFLDKIWLPDIRIRNLKDMNHFEKFGGINMNIYPNGNVYYSQLALVKFHCPMNLRNFPMDQQICFMNFSSYAYHKSLLTFVLLQKKVDRVNLPHFDFVEAKEVIANDEETQVKRVSIALIFNRRSGHYILQIYIPSLSLVILSWLAFLMNAADIANRLALVTTMLVSIVFLHSEMNTSLPPVSYAKASDWFVLVSFGFILFALLESSLVHRISRLELHTKAKSSKQKNWLQDETLPPDKQEEEIKKLKLLKQNTSKEERRRSCISTSIDKLSLFLFPVTYCGFNIFYWLHYT